MQYMTMSKSELVAKLSKHASSRMKKLLNLPMPRAGALISLAPPLLLGRSLHFRSFFGFRVFELFIRVSGWVFGPDLLGEKSLYQLIGKNIAIT